MHLDPRGRRYTSAAVKPDIAGGLVVRMDCVPFSIRWVMRFSEIDRAFSGVRPSNT
ncbi:MAG: hypothetical protein ACXABV_09825 [Candidatus Thorarchaeota archaeon]